jgi:hypothetical protein
VDLVEEPDVGRRQAAPQDRVAIGGNVVVQAGALIGDDRESQARLADLPRAAEKPLLRAGSASTCACRSRAMAGAAMVRFRFGRGVSPVVENTRTFFQSG